MVYDGQTGFTLCVTRATTNGVSFWTAIGPGCGLPLPTTGRIADARVWSCRTTM